MHLDAINLYLKLWMFYPQFGGLIPPLPSGANYVQITLSYQADEWNQLLKHLQLQNLSIISKFYRQNRMDIFFFDR